MNKILYGIIFVGVALLTFMGVTAYNTAKDTSFQAALPQAPAVFETSLQSPITSSATSMTLTANSVRGGGTLSGYNCFTIDEGSAQAEYVCGTVSGTSVTGMSRGISPSTGTTTIAALQFSHRRGANVKVTDFPVIQILKAQNNGEETFPNLLTYANTVLISGGSASTTIATKYYVDNVAIAGAANSSETVNGIGELATAAEAAAGTSIGSTLARLLLPASLATSTPTASCTTGCIVVAVSGKIAQAFLDLTATFTWTALHTFTGGLTSTATSTFAGSNVLINAVIFNSLAYSFPGTRNASSSALVSDASGRLYWDSPTGYATGMTSTSTNTGTMTITHNLGFVPRLIEVNTTLAGEVGLSTGTATSTASQYAQVTVNAGSGADCQEQDFLLIVKVGTCSSGSLTPTGEAALSAVTTTTFSLNWTTNGSAVKYIQWKAYK